jgi:NAD(P)-dependent dehydrogenase (short-subunit alcohol dehydrogenase family)
MNEIRFTAELLELFSKASQDRNPLHLSDEYARRTPYGGRVVFGVLDALTAIGLIPDRAGWVLSSVELDFFDTALLGINYAVHIRQDASDPSEIAVQVMDGRRPVLEAVLGFREGRPGSSSNGAAECCLHEPTDLTSAQLPIGHRASGKYSPSDPHFSELIAKLALNKSWLAGSHVAALLWASYLIGMELPGKRALFSRLRIEFGDCPRIDFPFGYDAEVTAVSPVGELSIQGTLSSAGKIWAKVELAAHVREDVPAITLESVERVVARGRSLQGKVALVTGASRGLGSALVHALALQGCTVVLNFARNVTLAERVRDSVSTAPGKVVLDQGDAGTLDWANAASRRIAAQFGHVDILICNASPPLLPLWLEPGSAERVNQFIAASIAMVSAPVMALLPQVSESKGWNILISSVAVTQPHPHFPHYSVAKCAAEALVRSAATEYRPISSLIVRPARLLTDLTNTPLGRKGAMPPELVAAAILSRIQGQPCPGKVEILEQFEGPQ